jgi:hypothetical protein
MLPAAELKGGRLLQSFVSSMLQLNQCPVEEMYAAVLTNHQHQCFVQHNPLQRLRVEHASGQRSAAQRYDMN